MGCSKDDITKPVKPTGIAHFNLDGIYYEINDFEIIYFSNTSFAFNSKGKNIKGFSIWFFSTEGNIHTRTFYVTPGEKLYMGISHDDQTSYIVGRTLLGYDYFGNGKITFSKYDYNKGIAEGTFEFSRDDSTVFSPIFKVTNGYFSIK